MQVTLEHQAEARRQQDVPLLGALATIDEDLAGRSQPLMSEADVLPHVNRVLSKPPKLRELRGAGALQSVRYVLTGAVNRWATL